MSSTSSTFVLDAKTALTAQQQQVIQQILTFSQQHRHSNPAAVFLLYGGAGSGKSVLLSRLFTQLQQAASSSESPFFQTKNYLLVNHNEMLKIYWQIAKETIDLHKKDFQKPTPFINQLARTKQKADIVVVDEAQLLLSQSDHFNRFNGQNQLDDLMRSAHIVILALDLNQVVKLKSFWSAPMLQKHLAHHVVAHATLDEQLRQHDSRVTDWIDAFVAGKLRPWPKTTAYELHAFDDGLPLFAWTKAHDAESGLSRLLATTDFPFRVFSHQDWYVQAGRLKLPWDHFNHADQPWASQPQTIDEVGSIYTIQGFDLNYAGVILGPSVTYDVQNDRIIFDSARFEDQMALQNRHHDDLTDLTQARRQVVQNVVNILLKRGRNGLGIYAVDPRLRARLLQIQAESSR